MRLVILLSVALLTGASRANAAHPTTYVYVLLGGFAGADGYVDFERDAVACTADSLDTVYLGGELQLGGLGHCSEPHLGAANQGYQGGRDRILRRRIAGNLVGEQHPAQEDRPGRDL